MYTHTHNILYIHTKYYINSNKTKQNKTKQKKRKEKKRKAKAACLGRGVGGAEQELLEGVHGHEFPGADDGLWLLLVLWCCGGLVGLGLWSSRVTAFGCCWCCVGVVLWWCGGVVGLGTVIWSGDSTHT